MITAQSERELVTEWVKQHTDDMFRFTVARVRDVELSQDLVQDTFIAAYESLLRFEERSQPKTWLYAILKNKIADYFRRLNSGKTELTLFFDLDENWLVEQAPSHWSADNDDEIFFDRLQTCLDALPQQQKLSLTLKYLENDVKDVPQELGISPSNYWQLLHRAKLRMRKCIETKTNK